MRILYCQKLRLPRQAAQAHIIHAGIASANFAAAGAATTLFPGTPARGAQAYLTAFYQGLGFPDIPPALFPDRIPFSHKALYGLAYRLKLWRAMRRSQPCVCFAGSVKEAAMALALRRLTGNRSAVKVIFEMHHVISRLKQGKTSARLYALERKVFSEADMVVFNCRELREQVRDYLPDPARSLVASLGFNERVIGPARDPALPEPGEKDGRLRLAYLGSLQPGKGVEELLRALALLPENYQLTIIGGGPDLPYLEKLGADLGLGGRIRFKGRVEQRHVGALLTDTDIFVIPLQTEKDFLAPMKMYEAVGFALPIAATPMVSLREQLVDGVNAAFADGTEPEALSLTIARLGQNPSLRKVMRQENQKLAARLSCSHRTQTLLAALEELF